MNWLDILFLAIAVASVIEGLRIGLSRMIIGLAAVIAGLLLGAWFCGAIAAYFEPYLKSQALARILAFLLIFAAVQAAGGLLGLLCARIFKWTGLGMVDRLLGAAGGVLKAAFAAAVIVLIFSSFQLKPLEEAVAGSRAAPYLIGPAQALVYLCPRQLRDDFAEARDRIRDLLRRRAPSAKPPADSV